MTAFILFAILVLVGVAIWQITKIFELSQFGQTKDDSQVANDKDNHRNGQLMFAFLVFIYLFNSSLRGVQGVEASNTVAQHHGASHCGESIHEPLSRDQCL